MPYRALSFGRVYRWLARLAAQQPNKVVGTAKDPWACPLVTYLRQRNPHTDPYVNAQDYSLFPSGAQDDPTEPTPHYHDQLEEWAQYFVANIDDLATERTALAPAPGACGHHPAAGGSQSHLNAVPITAQEALAVLRHWQKLQRLNRPPQPTAGGPWTQTKSAPPHHT